MKNLLAIFGALTFLFACSTENQKSEMTAAASDTSAVIASGNVAPERKPTLYDLQIGMRDEKVRALLGKPSKVDVISSELGASMEDWWYGSNQKVRMTGGQVTRVVKDVAKEQELLVKIKEAKERGDEAEAKRLMEEIEASE